MDFEYLSTEKKKILSQLNFTFYVLLQLWDLEKVLTCCVCEHVMSVWRHISFTRNGLCSVKRKKADAMQFEVLSGNLLGGTEENHKGFWGWFLLLQIFEPGTSSTKQEWFKP